MSTDDPRPAPSPDDDSGAPPERPTRTPSQDLPGGVRPAVEDDLDEPVTEAPPADAERRGRDPISSPLSPDDPDPLDPRSDTH